MVDVRTHQRPHFFCGKPCLSPLPRASFPLCPPLRAHIRPRGGIRRAPTGSAGLFACGAAGGGVRLPVRRMGYEGKACSRGGGRRLAVRLPCRMALRLCRQGAPVFRRGGASARFPCGLPAPARSHAIRLAPAFAPALARAGRVSRSARVRRRADGRAHAYALPRHTRRAFGNAAPRAFALSLALFLPLSHALALALSAPLRAKQKPCRHASAPARPPDENPALICARGPAWSFLRSARRSGRSAPAGSSAGRPRRIRR